MVLFVSGLIVFLATHFFTAFARGLRAFTIEKIGHGPYMGVYSLITLGGLVLIAAGWSSASTQTIYTPYPAMRGVTYILVLISFVLVAAAYLPAGKIAALTKHPMLAGVKVWAFAHLLSNGDLRTVLLFGGFLAFAVLDRIALKRRDAPVRMAGPARNDLFALALGAGLYVVVFAYLHRYIAGVPLY